jgi:hypothetical protein
LAQHLPARLTAAEGRKFGATVGGAFLALMLLLWWRDKPTASTVMGVLSAPFLLGALLVPTQLGPLQRAWMRLAHVISRFTTPIFMGIVYFLVLTPTGLILRALGKDPLAPPGTPESRWAVRAPAEQRRQLNRQF